MAWPEQILTNRFLLWQYTCYINYISLYPEGCTLCHILAHTTCSSGISTRIAVSSRFKVYHCIVNQIERIFGLLNGGAFLSLYWVEASFVGRFSYAQRLEFTVSAHQTMASGPSTRFSSILKKYFSTSSNQNKSMANFWSSSCFGLLEWTIL